MAKIVFLHGAGINKPTYWHSWANDIKRELNNRKIYVNNKDFDGIYYSDIFKKLWNLKDIEIEKEKFALRMYEHGIAFNKQNSILQRGILVNPIQNVIYIFGDIFYYFYNDDTFKEVNERVYEQLYHNISQMHLLGYSLGSLVAFCALQQKPQLARKVKSLIWIGSPAFWFATELNRLCYPSKDPIQGNFINLSGKLDIAWPQMASQVIKCFDEEINFLIHPFNPIKGHSSYFKNSNSLKKIGDILQKIL